MGAGVSADPRSPPRPARRGRHGGHAATRPLGRQAIGTGGSWGTLTLSPVRPSAAGRRPRGGRRRRTASVRTRSAPRPKTPRDPGPPVTGLAALRAAPLLPTASSSHASRVAPNGFGTATTVDNVDRGYDSGVAGRGSAWRRSCARDPEMPQRVGAPRRRAPTALPPLPVFLDADAGRHVRAGLLFSVHATALARRTLRFHSGFPFPKECVHA